VSRTLTQYLTKKENEEEQVEQVDQVDQDQGAASAWIPDPDLPDSGRAALVKSKTGRELNPALLYPFYRLYR
jgi:hypothetical protein